MQHFVGFASPGSADNWVRWKIGQSFDGQLWNKYRYQKLLKSYNPSSRYNWKCPGCFFPDTVYTL